MTIKLYDFDAYATDFDATVLSCAPTDKGYDTVLDRTLFFPEEGGQYADGGVLGSLCVLDVRIKDGVIHHYLPAALAIGASVHGTVDFAQRFEKMQCHSAEHIVSGLLHSHYGANNVGFHLGEREVTLDTDRPLSREQLDATEEEANAAVWRNLPIDARYPSPEELAGMTYRSKLALTEGVRIVTVPGIDVCACCAPHVRFTGEIGLIKLLDFMKWKGGTRIFLTAGRRALLDYRERYTSTARISALTSAKQTEIVSAVEKLKTDYQNADAAHRALLRSVAEDAGASLPASDAHFVFTYRADASFDELRALAGVGVKKIRGILAVLSPVGDTLRYLAVSERVEVAEKLRGMHGSLPGHGGGKGKCVQGVFTASEEDVRAYFSALGVD